jgi:NAD(P)H dehydrogenase (quinone)
VNVLIIHAHPEPRSMNGSLKRFAVQHLEEAGHAVQVSDLYAMNWKPSLDAADFPKRRADAPFDPALDSQQAFESGEQREDIEAEQRKLLWADAVILQFPMWWFSMPAILKGWVERVYAYGFGYGVGEHSSTRWGDRYGEGTMRGKRAMVITSTGGWESHYGPRGVNGPMDDLLFPILHGVLYYPGFDVLPPFVIYQTGAIDEARYLKIRKDLGRRLDELWTAEPIPFRPQNAGDYEIPSMELKPDIAPGQVGFAAHTS